MTYHVTRQYGTMQRDLPVSSFLVVLRELDTRLEDFEHTSVALTHESEWCLSVSRGGHVVFENLEQGSPCHMTGIPEQQIVELWECLARGDIKRVEQEPWGA